MPEQPAYAIVAACFYRDIADRLIAGAKSGFSDNGIKKDQIEVFEVPGSFELPLVAKYAAESGRFAGVVCLGVVVRGETDHYNYVCAEAARGIQTVGLETGVPCGFGVLTVDNQEQAWERSGGSKGDKGYFTAEVVLAISALKQELAN